MRVAVVRSKLVQVQESLVDVLLQGQGALHGFQSAAPLVTLRFLSQVSRVNVRQRGGNR